VRKLLLLTWFFGVQNITAQNLKSPQQFLGYELGEKFTPHYRIVNYFEQAATAMPQMMKLMQYGQTYEGRPLQVAVISSVENMSMIEDLRKNNLRLSSQLSDMPANINSPVIVWLSYNVHGDEASSSEVSMRTLYELLSPANPQTNQWLKNTIIIIDPCLNPDGRDRYVNWYNQVSGKVANTNEDSREHNEPWPGGRSNHYNFDLNRDWAWQSQVETQQRIKIYNQWMPAIHVDFHEQGPGSPYYFAPAAEPFHEVITPFQRSFQETIGKNHAKYFDAKGWLYFTKEIFDLFYPAYGDTWPIFNGAIGMTYEQAGSSEAGLSVALPDDTLTLKDRIDHHFTTSMSTIETASGNAIKLNTEFKKYFDDGKNNGNGIYKTYIVSGSNTKKLSGLTELFDRNNITYGIAGKNIQVKGYNYFNGKEENYTTKQNDLVITSYQSKSAFLKVLFEPQSKLSDSATYDITAWALPYAYGLQSYGVKEKLPLTAAVKLEAPALNTNSNTYGYLVEYNSINDGKMLAALLKQKFKLRFAEKDFTYNGKIFNKGSLVILQKGNEDRIAKLNDLSGQFQSTVVPVLSGFMESGFDFGSDKLHLLKKPEVAMLTGPRVSSTAAGEVWHFFEQQLEYPVTLLNSEDIANVKWKNFDVLIIPDGNYKFLTEKDGNAELKSWLRQGGKIIAMENAVVQMAAGEWGIKLKKEEEKPDDKKATYADIKKYENRERDDLPNFIPGAIYKVELDNSHPLAFGYPATYFTLKRDGNLYEFLKNGWNVGVIRKEDQVSGFVGSKLKEKLKDGTVLAVQQFGSGSIVYFADNPLFRGFWENGKLLFTNAVFLVGQ